MAREFGPRTNRVYTALRECILDGELRPGDKLPRYLELAAQFGVAPMTVRQVLARLEEEGLVVRRLGRGTFVRESSRPAVLIVDDDVGVRAVLSEYVGRSGYRVIAAADPAEALRQLERDPSVALVLAEVRIPTAPLGAAFIRTVRRRWPRIPLAAVTACPSDLAELLNSPECPVLILPKPIRERQVEEVLRLTLVRR
jgi:DNA-binding transcriptional regulator YhcF (GntR family)